MVLEAELPTVLRGVYTEDGDEAGTGAEPTSPSSDGGPSQWSHLSSLAWDISYSVVQHASKRRIRGPRVTRQILHNIVGHTEAGELVAVMGASGCGKSTLLSCLALRDQTFQGGVYLNERPVDKSYLSFTVFVDQYDLFLPALTVREHLNFQAMVRLGDGVDNATKMKRVDEVLRQMNLVDVSHTRIGGGKTSIRGLSTGERKRVSFATELLQDPAIIIADEPTTGLDSLMALTVCKTLRSVADTGRVVICSIHQPSSRAFDFFSHVLLLAAGRMAYYGATSQLVSYLEGVGLRCPEYYNPAEFAVQCLAIPPEGKKETESMERILELCKRYSESELAQVNSAWRERALAAERGGLLKGGTRKHVFTRDFSSSVLTQFKVSVVRTFLATLRDPFVIGSKMGVALGMGFIIGLGFRRPSALLTQEDITNLIGMMFLVTTFIVITAFFLVTYSLPSEMQLFLRDRIAGANRVGTFLMGHVIASCPFVIIWSVIFCLIVYFIAVPDVTASALGSFIGIVTLGNLASTALGYCVSAATMNETVALALVPPLSMPQLLFAGLVVKVSTIPAALRWLQHVSFVKYFFHSLVIMEFTRRTVTCPASPEPCTYHSSLDAMKSVETKPEDLMPSLVIMTALTVVMIVLGYFCLVRRCNGRVVR